VIRSPETGNGFQSRSPVDTILLFVGAMAGLGLVAFIHEQIYGSTHLPLLIAAFGATAVVLYGCPTAPIAQPRNLFCGSFISAFIGVSLAIFMPDQPVWMTGLLAVSLSLAAMSLTGTMHPPGGAIAFIAVGGPAEIHQLGFFYLLYPVGTGVLSMFLVALVISRLSSGSNYPVRWW